MSINTGSIQTKDSRTRDLPKIIDYPLTLLAIVMSCYHLYAIYGMPEWLFHRSTHVVFFLVIGFIFYKSNKKKDSAVLLAVDCGLALLSFLVYLYILTNYIRISEHFFMVTEVYTSDIIVTIVLILLILEMVRRMTGWTLVIVALTFITYSLYSKYFPGFLRTPGTSFRTYIEYMFFTSDGIFGNSVMVSSSYVFLFILFGVFLEDTGVGHYFISLADEITKKMRGGAAKTAIIASGLFGSISGSAVANVYATGTFTIPLMKSTGFSATFAGACEAVASAGGGIMPPVMGSSAFLMAEFIGVSYASIAKAAFIPAVLYYLSLWFFVDIEAKKLGMVKNPEAKDRNNRAFYIKRLYMFLPIIVIIVLLLKGYSTFMAAFVAIISTIAVALFNDYKTVSPLKILGSLSTAGKKAVTIAAPLTCASIVVASLNLTGMGLRLTGMILRIAGNSLPGVMFFTMIATIILGMGLPISAAYMIVAIFAPSALMQFGVAPLTAHLFCFYYASFSTITPPVAMGAYAGGVLSGASINQTGYMAMKLGTAAYIIPWIFVYSDAMLLNGTPPQIILAIISGILGVYCLSAGVQGYCFDKKINIFIRVLLLIAAVCMIVPGIFTDLIGGGIFLGLYLFNKFPSKLSSQKSI